MEMKAACERCGTALESDGEAFICARECTFCGACSKSMRCVCPNCGGELVRRRRRHGG